MLGTFQQAQLRIEVEASAMQLSRSLLNSEAFTTWLAPQQFSQPLPPRLTTGTVYSSGLGPLQIRHEVETAQDNQLRLLLSGGVDGVHEWQWGDGWVQSRLEGVSLLPLQLGHSLSLLRLRQYLAARG